MSQSVTEVFNNTVFAAGTWGSGGYDGVGFYTGGSVGTGTATLTGSPVNFHDPVSAVLNGTSMTLYAYADIANGGGIVLTTRNYSAFYVFLDAALVPSQEYALYYAFTGFTAPCFASGTHIATARGEVAVESLRVGDRVVALRGARFARVTWIGRRRVACRHHARGHDLWPVRVAAGAFGPDMPHRDLRLSPDHAVYVEGGLVPVRYLLNGATIVQTPVACVTYWHVELAAHDILLAEGLPAESYLDTGNRNAFDNDASAWRAPVLARHIWRERACAPLRIDPDMHQGLRQRLHARALLLGHVATDDPDLRVLADGVALPCRRDGLVWRATLPAGTAIVRLLSRVAAPSDLSLDSSDHRRLGVAVTRLALDGAMIAPGDPRRAVGWHAPEPMLQWTNGDAVLRCDAGPAAVLDITTAPLLRYWLPPVTEAGSPQAA
jgi:Hint domain